MRESEEGGGRTKRRERAGEAREQASRAIQQCLSGARRKLAIDSVLKPPTNNSH